MDDTSADDTERDLAPRGRVPAAESTDPTAEPATVPADRRLGTQPATGPQIVPAPPSPTPIGAAPDAPDAKSESCPKCWAALSTPLFCESCREILDASEGGSPFATLGVAPEFPLRLMDLRKRLLSLSRELHPDFHVNSDDATRARAERNTAELNAAFEILANDFHRADWLVKSLGGPGEADERQMPPAFLAEVLEWNETIEEARDAAPDSSERAALDPLETGLREQREGLWPGVADERVAGQLARVHRAPHRPAGPLN